MNHRLRFRCAAIALMSLFLAAGPGAADSEADPFSAHGDRLKELVDSLDLTPEQRAAVEPIVRRSVAERRAVLQKRGVEEAKGERASFRQLRKAKRDLQRIGKRTDRELAQILTAEQLEIIRSARDDARAEVRETLKERRKMLRASDS